MLKQVSFFYVVTEGILRLIQRSLLYPLQVGYDDPDFIYGALLLGYLPNE